MKKIIFLLFLKTFNFANSQSIIDESFINGNWLVKDAKIYQEINKSQKEFIDFLRSTTFIFNKNHTFKIVTPKKSKVFDSFINMFKDSNWSLSVEKSEITISDKSTKGKLMIIFIQVENNNIKFILQETKLTLDVDKI